MNFSKLLCLVLVYSEQFGQVLAAETPVCNGKTDDSTVQCRGKKGGAVKLKIKASVDAANSNVEWHKDGSALTIDGNKLVKSGGKDEELTINTLAETDKGEYKATKISPEEKFEVQVVDCLGGITTPALCQGKPGGSIELGLSGQTGTTFSWKKGTDTNAITADKKKYGPVTEAILEVKNLDDEGDDVEFTGGPTGSENEKFSVQVADCFGATGTVECPGKLGEKLLKLRISDTVTGTVTWEKVGGDLPVGNQKVGAKDVGLKLEALKAADVGTYKATYDTSNTVLFAVSVPDESGTSEGKKPTEKPKEGSGVGGLSYSPALLVTVTLVHLLLQLAA
ncbi:uncharacterized protein ACBT44_009335 [Syngnathus typhle]